MENTSHLLHIYLIKPAGERCSYTWNKKKKRQKIINICNSVINQTQFVKLFSVQFNFVNFKLHQEASS